MRRWLVKKVLGRKLWGQVASTMEIGVGDLWGTANDPAMQLAEDDRKIAWECYYQAEAVEKFLGV